MSITCCPGCSCGGLGSGAADTAKDIEKRLDLLKRQLEENLQHRINIEAIMDYYKKGGPTPRASGPEVVYAFDGQVSRGSPDTMLQETEERKNTPWVDMTGVQLNSRFAPVNSNCGDATLPISSSTTPTVIATAAAEDAPPAEDIDAEAMEEQAAGDKPVGDGQVRRRGFQQLAESVACPYNAEYKMHRLLAQFRIPAASGGNPAFFITADIYNDTGSQIQTIYRHDFEQLRRMAANNGKKDTLLVSKTLIYGVHAPPKEMDSVIMELRIVRRELVPGAAYHTVVPVTDWFGETFVIRDQGSEGIDVLLTGSAMRQRLYFATAPGNMELFVAIKKHGIVSRLPAV